MAKIVYVITQDPRERCELVSGVFAQALTALGFEHSCEIFVMDAGVHLFEPAYIAGLKAKAFDPLPELIAYYRDLGGKLYGCLPFMTALGIAPDQASPAMDGCVNASKLLESSLEADAVFTY